MKRIMALAAAMVFSLVPLALGQQRLTTQQIAAALKQVSPHVAAAEEREQLRTQVGRTLREQIAAANRASSEAWSKINSREEWEQFRREKLAALRRSLVALSGWPARPRTLVTGRLTGDGFQIHNLVYESRPGLVVTANLYVPDPPRDKMPGLLLSHAHHNPKHQGELQDMGMTWARAGCYVLVPDHLGHGERRQHPFAISADYRNPFAVDRQDYYFRYDASLQLYLLGESLMGWMVHDLMTGVDVLLAQDRIDSPRIILLGSVAGGGDPAAVTAALDERIACVVPFNFGGPQPENRYPLPKDAETSFNYAGGGSWESTRNLYRSAADGFLPWTIVASVAPRHVIHAHEFSWDHERDPVWKRYEKIWGFYGEREKLAFAHGFGTIQVNDPPGSHCNNIGAVHRRQIHEAFRKWFGIDVKPADEYSSRREREELTCLTDEARRTFQPKPLHEILGGITDRSLAAARETRAKLPLDERRKQIRESWTRLLGDVELPTERKVRDGSPPIEQLGGITVRRELLESEPGVSVPLMTLSLTKADGRKQAWRLVVLGVASDGIAAALDRRREEIAEALSADLVVALADVRGVGGAGPGSDRGQQSPMVSHSATALMLGKTILGGQLRDLRSVWRHLKRREDIIVGQAMVLGGSGIVPLASDATSAYPRRIDGRPVEAQPTGALLALLLGLYEDDLKTIAARHGPLSFRSALDSPYVQFPHDAMVPGLLRELDMPDLVAVLAPRDVAVESFVDGRGRLVPAVAAEAAYALASQTFVEAGAAQALQISDGEGVRDAKKP